MFIVRKQYCHIGVRLKTLELILGYVLAALHIPSRRVQWEILGTPSSCSNPGLLGHVIEVFLEVKRSKCVVLP